MEGVAVILNQCSSIAIHQLTYKLVLHRQPTFLVNKNLKTHTFHALQSREEDHVYAVQTCIHTRL